MLVFKQVLNYTVKTELKTRIPYLYLVMLCLRHRGNPTGLSSLAPRLLVGVVHYLVVSRLAVMLCLIVNNLGVFF